MFFRESLSGSASDEHNEKLIDMSEKTCYLHATLSKAVNPNDGDLVNAFGEWITDEMKIEGEEVCDEETGICYAYSGATGTSLIPYSGDSPSANKPIIDIQTRQTGQRSLENDNG